MRLALVITMCAAAGMAATTTAADERSAIDDLTAVENGRIITLDRPSAAPAEGQPEGESAVTAALDRVSETGTSPAAPRTTSTHSA